MEQQWLNWVYRINEEQENEPLAGRIEREGGAIQMPALERAPLEQGVCILSGSDPTAAQWLQVELPAQKKKGFLQWAARVLLGRLSSKADQEERFWSAKTPGRPGPSPLSPQGELTAPALVGRAEPLSAENAGALARLLSTMEPDTGNPRRNGGDEAPETDYTDFQKKDDENSYSYGAYDVKPDCASPAIVKFWSLYGDPQKRKNKKLWMEYFVSPVFFQVWRKPSFTAAMLMAVQAEKAAPPTPFLHQLCIAYGVRYQRLSSQGPDGGTVYSYQPGQFKGAGFPGIENVIGITQLGEPVCRLNHLDERIRAAAFLDYWELSELNRQVGQGGLGAMKADYERIISGYHWGNLEKPPADNRKPEWEIEYRDRDGLRLLELSLRQSDTPEEALRLAWEKLDLKNAASGSNRMLYGPLRQAVLDRLPQMEQQEKKSFFIASKAYGDYRTWCFDRQ